MTSISTNDLLESEAKPVKQYSVKNISDLIVGEFHVAGDPTGKFITNLRPVLEADRDSLVFISPDRKDKQYLAKQTKASVIICDASVMLTEEMLEIKCFIIVMDPKLAFARIGKSLFMVRLSYGIHPTAFVHPEAQIHPNTYVGPFTYIGKCLVGQGSFIHGHVHLYDGVKIGMNVVIHAGCVIGAEGFGYLKNEEGDYENFLHIGGVVIEDEVEIGANTCIDRGSLGNTLICKGAKIDNLVHVAHNVIVGSHALIIANAMLGGSSLIGEYAWISPSSVLRDQIRIGDHALVGLGAVVTKDVPAGETWVGSPARPLEEFMRMQKKIKDLNIE